MKIRQNKTRGNVLFATLFTTGIISLYLGSYLNMVRNENQLTSRSQTWNMAISIAEAGIEEALTQLNATYPILTTENGWNKANGLYYMKERYLTENDYYVVGIFPGDNDRNPPVIVSQGFSRLSPKEQFISRTIRVDTKLDSYSMPGLVVMETALLNGAKLELDSFNSTNKAFSTDGRYDPRKRGDKAYLATLSDLDGAIDLGNVDVWGKIASGHNGSPPKLGPQSTVGRKEWHEKNKGLEPGAYSDDVNLTVENPKAPFTSGLPLPTAALGVSVLGSGDYAVEHLSGKILVVGKARLLVTKSFDVSSLTISNLTGTASLELYVAAPSVKLYGNNQLNVNGRAANFKYFGLPENRSLGWPGNKTLDAGGNGELTAMIYAPQTSLVLHGGGKSAEDFSGACLVKSVEMKGHYGFHFDESCAGEMLKGFVAVSWDEIGTKWETILAENLAAKSLN